MTTVADLTDVHYSGDYRVDSLLMPAADWNFLAPTRATLYYTFDLSVTDAITPDPVNTFNATQKAAAAAILAYVSAITGIQFQEVASGADADMHFCTSNLSSGGELGTTRTKEKYAYYDIDSVVSYSADVFVTLDSIDPSNANPTAGSFGYQILLHEIGHALGLGHPFEGSHALPSAEDNTNNSVMSYDVTGANKAEFQAYDLLALQWIYGGDGLQGQYGYNSTYGPALVAQSSVIAGYKITGTSQADVLTGTSADDVIFAGAGNDVINASPGTDTIYGGSGIDTLVFSATDAPYGLTINQGRVEIMAAIGRTTLIDVERAKAPGVEAAFDFGANQSAGKAALLVGAVFGRDALVDKQDLLWQVIHIFDNGTSFAQLAGVAMGMDFWGGLANRGGTSASFGQIANYLLTTVNQHAPDAATLASATAALAAETGDTRGQFLAQLAASDANKIQVDLTGLAATGMLHFG